MNRVKELRKQKHITQEELGKVLDIQKAAISKYENGRAEPSTEVLKKMSAFFGVSIDYLLGNSPVKVSNQTSSDSQGVRIPVLGRVVAGIPIEAVEEILDYEEITPELAATGEFFALKIRGHSMEPRMMEGDVVIVRRQADVIQKSGVHSQWNGRRFLIL